MLKILRVTSLVLLIQSARYRALSKAGENLFGESNPGSGYVSCTLTFDMMSDQDKRILKSYVEEGRKLNEIYHRQKNSFPDWDEILATFPNQWRLMKLTFGTDFELWLTRNKKYRQTSRYMKQVRDISGCDSIDIDSFPWEYRWQGGIDYFP